MNDRKKMIKTLQRFFSDGNNHYDYKMIIGSDNFEYIKSKFFKLLNNPEDTWTFDIVKKNLNEILPKIIEKYGER